MDQSAKYSHPIAITLVEDNQYVRAGWEAVLSREGDFKVNGVFANCEEALNSPNIGESDIVLIDIGLPGMSGIDGVRFLKERYPQIVSVMCTVHDDDQHIFDALCAGAVGYLQKKIPPADLIVALREAASGGSPMTPIIARKVISSFQRLEPRSQQPGDILNERERQVLAEMVLGKSYATIAESLFLSVDGVRYHIRHIYEKLQVHSRTEAIAKGLRTRIIQPPR